MKQFKNKKILAFLLIFALVIGINAPLALANENDEFSVVISIEGLTLGQGIYNGPTEYTISEINDLLADDGYGPYTEDNLTAAAATLAFAKDHGLEMEHWGTADNNFYLSAVKDIDSGVLDIPQVITDNGGPSNDDHNGNDDGWLGEFDYANMAGWMITVNNYMIDTGAANLIFSEVDPDYGNTYVVRWHFTLLGFGADLGFTTGWGNETYFDCANKDLLYIEYARSNDGAAKSSALSVMENLTASQEEVDSALMLFREEPETNPQDVSAVLNEAMATLANTVKEPGFGTTAGEWTVIDLARGGYYAADDPYFQSYYERIVKIVNEMAADGTNPDVPKGALHKVKSTENSRLIMALSAIGKNANSVGEWNLIEPLNDFDWVKWQGINGPVFALIALDTHDYQTSDPSIRQQCIEYILDKQLDDGGWALYGNKSDIDVTAMALQALVNYKDETRVVAAADKAFAFLSSAQLDTGGYASWGTENLESIAQVSVACGAWGINPDTDSRFVKKGNSVIDGILDFYDADTKMFCHTKGDGGNGMATDQGIYGLVAYDRYIKGMNSLYDMSDVDLEDAGESATDQMQATLGLPAEIKNTVGNTFNASIFIDKWNNEGDYKLIDFIASVPEGIKVNSVTVNDGLSGGKLSYQQEEDTGKLRVVYFDPNENSSVSVSGTSFPAQLFQINFEVVDLTGLSEIDLTLAGMSVKRSSKEDDMLVVNTDKAKGAIKLLAGDSGDPGVGEGVSFTAVTLYEGDDVDLIPSTKKAVALTVTGLGKQAKLSYKNGENEIDFLYNSEISEKMGLSSYLALVDADLDMEKLVNKDNYTISSNETAEKLLFGDSNNDGVINAQDALAAVDFWLRKGNEPSGTEILSLNVTGDSRLNTFDALAIVEAFVDNSDYAIVNKALSLGTNP